MKKLWTILILGLSIVTLSACEGQNDGGENTNGQGDLDTGETPGDHAVDQESLDTLNSIFAEIEASYAEWEGKMLVNSVSVEDPSGESGTRDIKTRIHVGSNGDKIYTETIDVSDTDATETLNYLYVEGDTAYSFKSADIQSGEDTEDAYVKMETTAIEDKLPDVDSMFNQTFQFFPADVETAKMQGVTLLGATTEYDESSGEFEAEVNTLMETGTGEQNEERWHLSGDETSVTFDMPLPTLGTTTFKEIDFDEVVDPIDKDRHTQIEDDGATDGSTDSTG